MTIDGRRMQRVGGRVLPMKRDAKGATLVITLREGRNRQVRNMCEAIGHPVDHLQARRDRTAARSAAEGRLLAGPDDEEVEAAAQGRGAPASRATATHAREAAVEQRTTATR